MRCKGPLVGLGSLVALAVLAEGALRIVAPQILIRQEDVVPVHLGRFDPNTGWGFVPGSEGTSRRTGQDVFYRINSKGLRDDETGYGKPVGTYRVVLLGDSYSFGFGIEREDHVSVLLERAFEGLEVVNLGVNGFGVDQELLYLRAEGVRYQPDLVIAYVPHYGDQRHMHANRFGESKPQFLLEDGELVLTNHPVPEPALTKTGAAEAAHSFLRRRSALYAGLHELKAGRRSHRPRARDTTPRAGDAPAAGPAHGASREAINTLGTALVAAMRDEAERNGAEFLLITPVVDLLETASAAGVRCLPIGPILTDAQYELPDDLGHLDPPGNVLLTRLLADTLVSDGLVPADRRR